MTSDPNSPDNEPDATRISTPRGARGGAGDAASDDSTRFIPALHFRTGQMILARYRLRKPLGRGGFGVVWRASDENLHIDVAIKFLAPEIVHNPEAIEDLKQETRYSLRLTHPNIVRIHGFFQEPELAGILMEYVDGGTLQALKVERPGRFFEAAEVGAWIPALCDALDYAHAKAKVVHRDLKPGNIMLDSSGDVKIADFGISSSISDTHSRLSLASGGKATSGTPVYMSPQHLMGSRPSVADDIYSFGATLYDLLAGKPPFYTGDIPEQVRLLAPPSIAERRRELGVGGAPVPPAWEQTIAACLAKNPGDRPSSAGHVAAMLGFGSRSAAAGGAAASRDADPLADQADLFATRPARPDTSGTGAPSGSGAASEVRADSGAASAHARSSEGGLAESQAGAPSATDRGRSTDRSAKSTPRPGAEVVDRPGPREIARAAPRELVRTERPRSRISSRIPIAICAVVVIAVAVLGAMKIFGGRGGSGGGGDRAATTGGRTAGSAASGDAAAGAGSAGESAPIGSASGGVAEPSAAGGTASDAPPPTAPDAPETPGAAGALDDARAANEARAAELRTSIVARMRAQEWAAAARESEALLALAPNDREASQWLEISRSRARAEDRASGSRAGAAGSADRSTAAAAGSDPSAGSARPSGEQPPAPSTRATESEPPPPPPAPARAQQSAPAPSPEDGVRTTLARYESALEALDAAAYASLWQSMDGDERRKIERSFQQFSAQSVELAVSAIEIDASRATARFSEKRKLTPVVGSPLTQERNVSMKLERADDGSWRIVSMN